MRHKVLLSARKAREVKKSFRGQKTAYCARELKYDANSTSSMRTMGLRKRPVLIPLADGFWVRKQTESRRKYLSAPHSFSTDSLVAIPRIRVDYHKNSAGGPPLPRRTISRNGSDWWLLFFFLNKLLALSYVYAMLVYVDGGQCSSLIYAFKFGA